MDQVLSVSSGSTHQGSSRYVSAHNLSCVSNAVCAVALSLFSRDVFSDSDIDDVILPTGYNLYMSSVNFPRFIEVSELLPTFSLKDQSFSFTNEIIIQDQYPRSSHDFNQTCSNLSASLHPYVDQQTIRQGFIFIGLGRSVSFWSGTSGYYVFDSHAVGRNGSYDFNDTDVNVARLFLINSIETLCRFLLLHGIEGSNAYYGITRIEFNVAEPDIVSSSSETNDMPLAALASLLQIDKKDDSFSEVNSGSSEVPLALLALGINNENGQRCQSLSEGQSDCSDVPLSSIRHNFRNNSKINTGVKRKAISSLGRPTQAKKGRPTKRFFPGQQSRESSMRHYQKNKLKVQKTTKKYTQCNPNVHRSASSRYVKSHAAISRNTTTKHYQKSWNIHSEKSLESVTPNLLGQFRGEVLNKINTFQLKFTNLYAGDIKCPKCQANLFYEEKNRKEWCCQKGSIAHSLPKINATFYENTQFLSHARAYNNLFSFSALGVSQGFQHPRQGITFLKIQGRTYHRIFDLAYSKTFNPLSLYIADPTERDRETSDRKLNLEISKAISDYLHSVNPFIKLFKQLSAMESENAHIVFQNTTRRTHGNILGDMPQNNEIALLYDTERGNFERRTIAVWKIGEAKPHTIDIMHELYEPLQYPLLYPYGTPGWRLGLKDNDDKKLSQLRYYRHLLLTDSRFTSLGHLSDEWVCDMFCRTEEERLRYIDNSNRRARVANFNELPDETIQGEGELSVGRVYLPNTFTAGPRYMRTKYMDAMAIVNRLGKPSFFLTMTCNPSWPELKEHRNNAALCARVFHAKMRQLLREIKSGKWFGPVVYLFYCVEFQKRGLPHLHTAFRVTNPPVQTNDIDNFIRADIPSSDEAGGRLKPLVMRHMIHGPCGHGHRMNLPCVNNDQKKCSKFFPRPPTNVTYIDNRGFVHLRRDEQNVAELGKYCVNDRWVVPYNPGLLLRFDCHINLEVVASRNLPQYLYKYITKGPDYARVQVVSEADQNSEIEEYVTKRYLSAPECCWRLFSYDIVHRVPNVIQLPVHLEGQHSVIFRPGHLGQAMAKSSSLLLIYLNRPINPIFDKTTYLDFYENYIVHSKRPKKTVEVYRHPDNVHYITRRQRGEMVARMFWVPPSRGELYYLRLLLGVIPARSYNDLLCPGDEPCTTYQSAARSIGLANDNDEYELALQEASSFMTGRALRRFFVLLITNGAPGEKLWDQYRDQICFDFIDLVGDKESAYKLGLLDIKRSLNRLGLSLLNVGLPDVEDDSTELGRELIGFNVGALNDFLNSWVSKLSCDQKRVFEYVKRVLSGININDKKALFIDGPAGTGKTLLLNVIAAFVRSIGKVAVCTATSGIAAQNYPGGMTAHSMFKLPIILPDDVAYWGISNGTERAQLLHASGVIIFDEAPMAHKNYLGLLERSFRDLMQSDLLFGDKLIIFAGDFRQIPPVVKGARGKGDYVSASFKSSEIWRRIKIFKLNQTQRNRDDLNYSNFLLKMGSGLLETINFGTGREAVQLLHVPQVPFCTALKELIDFAFPNDIISSPDSCHSRAILSVLNLNIVEINLEILNILEGSVIHLYSSDFMDDTDAQAFLMGCDALNQVQAPGVPNHDLVLKIGALCMITRNLSFEDGLLNGTKVVIVQATTRIVTVRKPGESVHHAIPRILFKVDMDDKGMVTFSRRQFPLQLAYAMTINKSQGQTLDCVGLDMRSDVFTHGQAYVAFGRVRASTNIKILVDKSRVIDNKPYVRNIVYSDLLD